MKKWLLVPVLLISAACARKEPEIYFTPAKAIDYLRLIDSICLRDNGIFWGENISGPVMFVDRPTRRIFASRPDDEGLLRLKDGIYQGSFPRERVIENAPLKLGGVYYATVPLPREENSYRILTLAISALYRLNLLSKGIEPETFLIHYLDDKPARVWLKLEYKALKKALLSDSSGLANHLRDAIIFRSARREHNRVSVNTENRFEKYYGLSLLTSVVFCNPSEDTIKEKMIENVDFFYSLQSYPRSSGTILGAVYGYLLYKNGYDLKTIKMNGKSIDSLIVSHFKIELPEISRDVAGSLAVVYDVDGIYKEEEQRLLEIRERARHQLSKYTEKPVLTLDLGSPYFYYEPEDIRPLDTLGTIYNSLRVSDNWGKLSVDRGGCLLTNNLRTIRLGTKNMKESKNHIYGEGWQIFVNNGWRLVKEDDNYTLRKNQF